jgi:hypothetical protein
LLQDPLTRAAYHRLAASPSFADALDGTDGDVRALLERLAVEEPDTDDEPETLRARLLVINVEPVATRALETALADGDEERGGALKRNLDELVHAREIGEWDHAEEIGRRLLQWIAVRPEHSS